MRNAAVDAVPCWTCQSPAVTVCLNCERPICETHTEAVEHAAPTDPEDSLKLDLCQECAPGFSRPSEANAGQRPVNAERRGQRSLRIIEAAG